MESAMATILIVDDEPHIREVVELYLRRESYSVVAAADGEEALRLYRQHQPQLVVLDLMLPKLSGMEVCRRIQAERRVPLIMLTAKGAEEDRIIGLGMGADDYLPKPFSPRELVARVGAVLRRIREATVLPPNTQPIRSGDIYIDPSPREVRLRGAPVALTAREFDLLYHFAAHPKQVFTRDQLMDAVWGYDFVADTSTVTVHIRRLREKIEVDPSQPRYIVTVWGVGYRWGGE
jgi:DNA-binding response OmpR family regulator